MNIPHGVVPNLEEITPETFILKILKVMIDFNAQNFVRQSDKKYPDEQVNCERHNIIEASCNQSDEKSHLLVKSQKELDLHKDSEYHQHVTMQAVMVFSSPI